jgi:hypothetical protein
MPSVEAAWKAERLVGRTKRVQALGPAGHLPRLRPVPTTNPCKRNILVAAALLNDGRHVAGTFINDGAREDECYESAARIAC